MANYGNQRGGFISGIFPPVIKALIIINVAIFLLQTFFFNFLTVGGNPIGNWIINIFALQPIFSAEYGSFSLHHFWIWQLISYQFLHGGLWHLFFNMFALWMFGMELERLWGSKRFLIYYLICGIGAGLCQLFISPMFGPTAPTIGASGAIYGVLLGFGMTFPNRPIFMFPLFIPIPARIFVILFAGIELFSGFTAQDGVAHFAHLGGALIGLLLILFGDKTGFMPFLERLFSNKRKSSSTSTRDFYSQSTFRKPGDRPNSTNPSFFQVKWQNPKDTPSRKLYEIEDEDDESKYRNRSNPSAIFIEGEEITQRKIDEILDKISEQGYQSLSEKEKKILLELSKKL